MGGIVETTVGGVQQRDCRLNPSLSAVGRERFGTREVGEAVPQHPRLDGPGGDGEHPDAVRLSFIGGRLREHVDPRLRPAVDREAGERVDRGQRREVDDRAAPSRLHHRPDRPRAEEHRRDVGPQAAVEHVVGGVGDRGQRGIAGVVDEDVDAAEPAHGRVDHRAGSRRRPHVGDDRLAVAAAGHESIPRGRQGGRVAGGDHDG
jgi:hypothetical protein